MTKTGGVAICHDMKAGEGFLETAGMLWFLVRDAAARYPGWPRRLYLDIEGHGQFEPDAEAAEVISFTRAALGPFLTETDWGRTDENAPQSETLPDVIVTSGEGGRPVTLTGNRDEPVHDGPGLPPGADRDKAVFCAIYARTHGSFAEDQETEDHG